MIQALPIRLRRLLFYQIKNKVLFTPYINILFMDNEAFKVYY
jgi:hypothetical protein